MFCNVVEVAYITNDKRASLLYSPSMGILELDAEARRIVDQFAALECDYDEGPFVVYVADYRNGEMHILVRNEKLGL